jgi:hypothetical protein
VPHARPSRSKLVRKSIARVLTVMNQAKKDQLRIFYKVRARSNTGAAMARRA